MINYIEDKNYEKLTRSSQCCCNDRVLALIMACGLMWSAPIGVVPIIDPFTNTLQEDRIVIFCKLGASRSKYLAAKTHRH